MIENRNSKGSTSPNPIRSQTIARTLARQASQEPDKRLAAIKREEAKALNAMGQAEAMKANPAT